MTRTQCTDRSVLYSGYTVLCCAADGSIGSDPEGLYHFDCRIVSRHRLRLGGRAPTLVTAVQPAADEWTAVLRIPREGGTDQGPILPQDALEVVVHRWLGPVMRETITVRNRSAASCESSLTLEIDADFRDVEAGDAGQADGEIRREWDGAAARLRLTRAMTAGGGSVERGLAVHVVDADSPARATDAGIELALDLGPRAEWSVALEFESLVDGRWYVPDPGVHARRVAQRDRWRATRVRVDCDPWLRTTFDRAADDLFDLRNWELEDRHLPGSRGSAWVLDAGVPMFTGFFGRDTLTAGWQSSLLGPRGSLGALAVAAATQSDTDDAWRDSEPGKMVHEMRRGPLADLELSPRDAYYGTQTTPAMFMLALSEAWQWTGDDALLRRYREPALRTFEWAERHGDRDGDGFLEYVQRSPKGLKNQGWKDSNEAIRYPDGRLVENPIATVEEQAFHYVALLRMAEVLVALDEGARAAAFLDRAERLRAAWHEAFWMPEEEFYALALDPDKRQVRSIASNPGHALAAGIVPAEHAQAVADRLLSDELFSGWGVRSLSARHPSYNPFAYHLGAVWPVEQATLALGFKRYGLDDQADRLVEALFDAAAASADGRLPEALSGHDRSELGSPVVYPDANSPQAWSSSAVVQAVQVMLGIYPFAPLRVLGLVRPRLPAALPNLTIRNLRVGRASVDIRFERRADGSAAHTVVRRRGPLLVVPSGPPEDAAGGVGHPFEALERELVTLAPGRLARAARIAIGLGR